MSDPGTLTPEDRQQHEPLLDRLQQFGRRLRERPPGPSADVAVMLRLVDRHGRPYSHREPIEGRVRLTAEGLSPEERQALATTLLVDMLCANVTCVVRPLPPGWFVSTVAPDEVRIEDVELSILEPAETMT